MVSNRRISATWFLPIFATLLLAGCDGTPTAPTAALHKVTGKVVLGRPGSMAGIKIQFVPTKPGTGSRFAYADLKDDGGFELSTDSAGDGIAEGDYKIKLEPAPQLPGEKAKKPLFPSHLMDEDGSGITQTITSATTNLPPIKLAQHASPVGSGTSRVRD